MEWSRKGISGCSRPHHVRGCPVGPYPSGVSFSAGHCGLGAVVGVPPGPGLWDGRVQCRAAKGSALSCPRSPAGVCKVAVLRGAGMDAESRAGRGVPASTTHPFLSVRSSCGRGQSGVKLRARQICAPLRLGAFGWEWDVGLAQPSPLCSIPSSPATAPVTHMLSPAQPLSSPIGPFWGATRPSALPVEAKEVPQSSLRGCPDRGAPG